MVTEPLVTVEVSPSLDWVVQPLVDTLYQGDLETRRSSVAALGRQATPDANRLLRELLADPQPEVRSDASIALTKMEEQLAQALNNSFEHWMAQPENQERTAALADQYYSYATSNILDKPSQRSYLQKARELLQQLVERNQEVFEKAAPNDNLRSAPLLETAVRDDAAHLRSASLRREEVAGLWYKLARVYYAMGELPEALHSVQKALVLQPEYPEATALAMDVAFRSRSWNRLIAYGGNREDEENNPLHWWNNSDREVKHG
jgi:tetratricopeptide (TPR) repeat protein